MLAVLVRWGLRLLALLIGACLALSFPAVNAWWWAWVGLVPLLLLLARAGSFREAAWRGWFAAAGFFVTLHHWVLPYLGVFSVAAAVLGPAIRWAGRRLGHWSRREPRADSDCGRG